MVKSEAVELKIDSEENREGEKEDRGEIRPIK